MKFAIIYIMRPLTILIIVILVSCSDNKFFYNKEYYEKTSFIRIPEKAEILESIDNGEFVTATVFRVDSLELLKFARSFEFTPCEKLPYLKLMSDSYLKKYKPHIEEGKGYLYKIGNKGKNSWLYIIDTQRKLLWAEIQYPDAAGN